MLLGKEGFHFKTFIAAPIFDVIHISSIVARSMTVRIRLGPLISDWDVSHEIFF